MCDVLCALYQCSMGHARCTKRCVLCEAHCVLPVHEEVHAAAPINQGFHHKAVVKVIETASCIYAVSENSRFSSMKEKDFSSKIDVTGYSHLL